MPSNNTVFVVALQLANDEWGQSINQTINRNQFKVERESDESQVDRCTQIQNAREPVQKKRSSRPFLQVTSRLAFSDRPPSTQRAISRVMESWKIIPTILCENDGSL